MQYKQIVTLIVICFSLFSISKVHSKDFNNKIIIGSHENIVILPGELIFDAKIDTGASNSSMHATDIEFYTQNDGKYVRFKTLDKNDKTIILDLPLHRTALIKRHGGESLRRAVVKIGICMANRYKQVEVTLTDRSKFKSRFLIGTSFLINDFIVDVANQNLRKASCNSVTGG